MTARLSLVALCAIFLFSQAAAQTSSSKAKTGGFQPSSAAAGSDEDEEDTKPATPKKSVKKSSVSSTPKKKSTAASTPKASPSASPKPKSKATPGSSTASSRKKAGTASGAKSTPKTTPKPESTPATEKDGTPESVDPANEAPLPSRDPKPSGASGQKARSGDSATITAAVDPAAPPSGKISAAPNASLSPRDLVEFDTQPPRVKKLIETALDLTTRNLTYAYGSADPAQGGMDCSGFIYYVLRQNGFKDVPRQASQQYVWVRKANEFDAVLSKKKTSFELDDLLPGDLLLWTGTYSIDRDPPVTHSMIYLGVERATKKPVMVGSSDGRSYAGKSRWGVSVFDFNGGQTSRDPAKQGKGGFVGYATIPGLRD